MKTAARLILLSLLFAGCYDVDVIEHSAVDADVDASIDGSGSDAMAAWEPSPRDGNLELVVVAASLLVVLGPLGVARRTRRDSDGTDAPPAP